MPLLMCPNDNAQMQTLDRNGVQFDMCPSCRGVWLDRGELEKLMALEREDAAGQAAPPPRQQAPYQAPPQPQQHYAPPPRYEEPRRYKDDDDRHRYGQQGHYKKKKGFDLFDIFD